MNLAILRGSGVIAVIAILLLATLALDPVAGTCTAVGLLLLWVYQRQVPTQQVSLVPRDLLFLLVLIGLVIPAVYAHYRSTDAILGKIAAVNGSLYLQDTLILTGLLAALLLIALRWQLRDRWFYIGVTAFFLMVKLYYVIVIDAKPVSDFYTMLAQANRWVENGGVPPFSEMNNAIRRIHGERILLYLYPLRLLFESNLAWQISNVLVTVGCTLIAARLAHITLGANVARAALVFSLFAIEPLQAAEIPSHDIPGALSLLVVIWISVELFRGGHSNTRYWSLSVGLGAALLWVSMQRGIGVVVILSMALVALLRFAQDGLRGESLKNLVMSPRSELLGFFLLPVLVFFLLGAALQAADYRRGASDSGVRRAVAIAAHTESWGNGSYGYWKKHWLRRSLPEDAPMDFAAKRLMNDIYHSPLENISHYFRKARRLYAFGTHQGFYLNKATIRGDDSVSTRDKVRIGNASNIHEAIMLFFLAVGSLFLFMKRTRIGAEHYGLVVLSSFSLLLILAAEVQSRYLFPIWYIGAIYAGYGLACLCRKEGKA